MKKLSRSFYNRNTIDIAIDLLGCRIISNAGGIRTGGIIVEAEAYRGPDDPACHAFRGLTKRNRVMFGPPGFLYVYFTYGNHHMLNVVTERDGFPAAVLLRAVEPQYGVETMANRRMTEDELNISSGPGKLAKALGVTLADNDTDLTDSKIFIAEPSRFFGDIKASSRIGIGQQGHKKLWRFYIGDNPHVSMGSRYERVNSFELKAARKMRFEIK
jgi:DNA-3-methyladenine glycosylase